MLPLTLDDLLPLAEYASRRREFFDSLRRYTDRYRRVRVGPSVTLLFENRQTLWFRVQEVVRVARLNDPVRLQQELDLYNRLLPGPNQLQAALLLDVPDEDRLAEVLAPWHDLQGEHLRLRVGEESFPAMLVTCRPEDRCTGSAHWVQFTLDASGRRGLADFKQIAFFEFTCPHYLHSSSPLGDEVRQSLLDDLALSDRNRAA
jgi:hypothetical protein